jgi:hypothetical protein
VIHDPIRRGRELAEFYAAVEPRLYADLEESGLLATGISAEAAELRRHEWACFALYACVRGLIGAGGFNRETAAAIDALHGAVLERWMTEPALRPFEERRANVAERYAEYGTIGQDGGAAGAITVTARLGTAAAGHLAGAGSSEELASLVGALHEALVEGSTEAVRRAGDSN